LYDAARDLRPEQVDKSHEDVESILDGVVMIVAGGRPLQRVVLV
jgi:hypothetical protein